MQPEAVFATPVGWLALTTDGGRLSAIEWVDHGPEVEPPAGLARAAIEALGAWFADPRELPALPLVPAPTPFQQRVRQALQAIPCGSTRTYSEVAAELGSSPRAVGGACRRNPLPLIVPCHRIVARSGLGGYGGDWQCGAARSHKEFLLALEAGC